MRKLEFKLKKFDMAIEVTRIANVHYFEFTKEYHTTGDSHPFCELVYVDDGAITVSSESYSGKLLKNQLIIHKSGEIHSLGCDECVSPSIIIIGFECKSAALLPLSSSPVTLGIEEGRLLSDVIREGRSVFLPPYDIPNLEDMKKRADYPFGADQLIKLKLECLLINLVRGLGIKSEASPTPQAGTKAHEIHAYLTNNYRENISLEELSFLFGTNKTTLCKCFKESFGTTVIAFVNALRIKEARRLIRDGNKSIAEISEALGFSSVHYFSRLFKRLVGRAPREYINTIKAKLEE